jgi:type IV pilus assembly protein PilM
MAKKTNQVWGIELGQFALKALRCRMEGDQVVADMFDIVEYPKILSQPEAEPEMLVVDAIQQFLSRNDLRGSRVGVSVPGQSGLAKFFKPPPVEVKKIPDIVKYEAKQQIPFDLNDVIWDFQQMAGSNIEDGYALESEVGLFAMKREAVARAIKPFKDANIDVDLIQLAPISVYNMIAYDRFSERMATSFFDPDTPPPSTIVLSMGTDASDLVVTNGFRIWQRNIPIGGNHFTRQLLKDLKLTFAKAEHLKRNVMQSDDPKLVFQVMRPVFNDLVTEIQRSIGFFKSLNKKAELESILVLGNTARLPGLIPFMNKNLGMEVRALEKYERLSGNEVLGQPTFKENQAGFGVVYGLCLQLLNQGPMKTNLLPREIVVDRLVRAKKPWAIGALSAVLLACVANYASVFGAFKNVATEKWGSAESSVQAASATSGQLNQVYDGQKGTMTFLSRVGAEVSSNGDRRLLWMELLKGIQGGLRRDPSEAEISPVDKPYSQREEFHLNKVDSVFVDDLSRWFQPLSTTYIQENAAREKLVNRKPKVAAATVPSADGSTTPEQTSTELPPTPSEQIDPAAEAAQSNGPVGPGWVVQIEGYHYFNGKRGLEGAAHVRKYLIDYLEFGEIELPGPDGQITKYSMKELGVSFPVISQPVVMDLKNIVPNPEFARVDATNTRMAEATGGSDSGEGSPGAGRNTTSIDPNDIKVIKDANGKDVPSAFPAPKCSFIIQFAWQEKTLTDRTWWRQQPSYNKNLIPAKKP